MCKYQLGWSPFDIQTCYMDLKSPGTQGVYVDFIRDSIQYLGNEEMSNYYLREILFDQMEVEEGNEFNTGSYVQCKLTLGRRLLSG